MLLLSDLFSRLTLLVREQQSAERDIACDIRRFKY
jgi:hypothetical protein